MRKRRKNYRAVWIVAGILLMLALFLGYKIVCTSEKGEREIKESGSGSNAGPVLIPEAEEILSEKAPEEQPETEAAPEAAPRLRIVLDPGHGGPGLQDEPELGAVYRNTYEKILTLKIAEAAKAELEQYGNVEVFLTRETDTVMTLKERAAYAESAGAAITMALSERVCCLAFRRSS